MVHVCYLNRKYVKLKHEMGAADKRRDPKLFGKWLHAAGGEEKFVAVLHAMQMMVYFELPSIETVDH